MTKQEIKDLVAAKISGQGNQLDIGNVLPKVIDEVVDLIPDAAPEKTFIWDITAMGEIAEEVDVPAEVKAGYNGQQALLTRLGSNDVVCILTETTDEYLVFTDSTSVSLWVKYNGKIKPADHD